MTNSEEIILINITGKDRPGLTATLADTLAQYDLNILDIGQAVIHDYLYANDLEIQDGKLTGNLVGEVIDGPKKAELLQCIALRENIRLVQTVAVGEGANDLPMLSIAGLGVAFHAKPMVREKAQRSISNVDLAGLLYLIGISESEIQ